MNPYIAANFFCAQFPRCTLYLPITSHSKKYIAPPYDLSPHYCFRSLMNSEKQNSTHSPFYILIVEDEPILADIIRKKLMSVGYEVDIAPDGVAGLMKIQQRKPDLLLLDIRLPKKDGYQVIEHLRAHEYTQDLPVLIISNSGQPVELERFLAFGICDYLIKAEFSPQEVLSKVRACLKETDTPQNRHAFDDSGRNIGSDLESIDDQHAAIPMREKKKVLLVEDDKMLSDLAYMQLFRDGFDVEIVIDGESVLPKIQRWMPDIILLDIRLPDMDGFEVMEQLRKSEQFHSIPTIIISNFDQESFRNRARELGAADYLIKANLDTHAISEKVKEILHII